MRLGLTYRPTAPIMMPPIGMVVLGKITPLRKRGLHMKRSLLTAAFLLVAALGFAADAPAAKVDAKKPVTVSYVTNNASDFWQIARAGVEKAEKDFGVKCEFKMPATGAAAEQQRIVEELIAKGIQGMAISPIDPANQTDMLDMAAAKMPLICHDSDAPKSKRLAYVGTNNIKAGIEAGNLIKEVLPNGARLFCSSEKTMRKTPLSVPAASSRRCKVPRSRFWILVPTTPTAPRRSPMLKTPSRRPRTLTASLAFGATTVPRLSRLSVTPAIRKSRLFALTKKTTPCKGFRTV